MGYPLSFTPDGGGMYEITCRTVGGMHLIPRGPEARRIIVGVLGRAQELYGVTIHAFVFLSNHYHLLISVKDSRQRARFMGHVNSNLARELGHLTDWRSRLWARRYRPIAVSSELAAQVRRLGYILAHGVKEGLVEHPGQWTGAHCVEALLEGAALEGDWIDRSALAEGLRRKTPAIPEQHTHQQGLELSPLPCWATLSPEERRTEVALLVEEITRAGRFSEASISTESPASTAPEPVDGPTPKASTRRRTQLRDRRPAPRIHAVCREIRLRFLEAYAAFEEAFREAAEQLRAGCREVTFPPGSFPPGLPFVESG